MFYQMCHINYVHEGHWDRFTIPRASNEVLSNLLSFSQLFTEKAVFSSSVTCKLPSIDHIPGKVSGGYLCALIRYVVHSVL
jgi:hypothetical protein